MLIMYFIFFNLSFFLRNLHVYTVKYSYICHFPAQGCILQRVVRHRLCYFFKLFQQCIEVELCIPSRERSLKLGIWPDPTPNEHLCQGGSQDSFVPLKVSMCRQRWTLQADVAGQKSGQKQEPKSILPCSWWDIRAEARAQEHPSQPRLPVVLHLHHMLSHCSTCPVAHLYLPTAICPDSGQPSAAEDRRETHLRLWHFPSSESCPPEVKVGYSPQNCPSNFRIQVYPVLGNVHL